MEGILVKILQAKFAKLSIQMLQLQKVEIPYPQREVRLFDISKDQAAEGRTKIPASAAD